MRRDTRLAAYGTYGFTLHWLKKIDIMPPKSKPDPPAPHPYSDLVVFRSTGVAREKAAFTIDPRYPKSLIPGYRRKQVCKRGIISVVVVIIAYAVHQVHIYIRRLA